MIAPDNPLRRELRLLTPLLVATIFVAGSAACDSSDQSEARRTESGGRPEASPPARFELTATDLPAEAEATLRVALDMWSALVSSPVPIRVRATFVENGPAGFAAPGIVKDFPGAPLGETWYVSALADAIAGTDLRPGLVDMELFFRRNRKWKFGTEGDPAAGEADFLTVAMHEIAHGLGMATWISVRDGVGSYGGDVTPILSLFPLEVPFPDLAYRPSVFTVFLADPAGRRIADTTWMKNPSESLGRLLASDELFFAGPAATAANGGRPPRVSGVSPSHLHTDEYFWTGPDYLMTVRSGTGVATPDPGPVLLGILEDIGWTVLRNR